MRDVPMVRIEMLNGVQGEGEAYQVSSIDVQLINNQAGIVLSTASPDNFGGTVQRHFVLSPPAAAQLGDLLCAAAEAYLRPIPPEG